MENVGIGVRGYSRVFVQCCFHPTLNASEGGLLLPPTGISLDTGDPAQVCAPPPTHQLRLLRLHRLTRSFKSLRITRYSELLGLKADPEENRLLPEIHVFGTFVLLTAVLKCEIPSADPDYCMWNPNRMFYVSAQLPVLHNPLCVGFIPTSGHNRT